MILHFEKGTANDQVQSVRDRLEGEGIRTRSLEHTAECSSRLLHLDSEFAKRCSTSSRGRLICHRAQPLDPAAMKQRCDRHQHEADGAVAAHERPAASGDPLIDPGTVDRIENHHSVVR